MAQTNRNINYINRDFGSFRQSLINYAQSYFPNSYNDFTPSSVGMLFLEMSSYVGDVLSFYLDNQIQETFLPLARQTDNIYNMAYTLGYKPKISQASTVDMDVFQQVPSKLNDSGEYIPDFNYALSITENTQVSTNDDISFLIQDSVDFSVSSSIDPTSVSIYRLSGNTPEFFLLKKTRKAISANVNQATFTFNQPIKFDTRNITTNNFLKILDVYDSNGNRYYEVDNLSQDLVYSRIKNTNNNNPYYSADNLDAGFLLKTQKVQRRFTTRILNNNTIQLQFGAGNADNDTEDLTPNPNNVGLGLPFQQEKLTTAFSPLNFVLTNSYGITPSNTTLTVRYLTGGGLQSNVASNSITKFPNRQSLSFNSVDLPNSTLNNLVLNSVAFNNPLAADGGGSGDTLQEIKINALGQYPSQLRTVTVDDYIVRSLSMPSDYGSIAKVFVTPSQIGDQNPGEINKILDLYVLSFNSRKQLQTPTLTLKENLRTYLSEYRMINDSVRIKEAFVINIGIDFDIVTLPGFINSDVLGNCISTLRNYFNIDNWEINEPIIMSDLFPLLDKIDGVQTVKEIKITNKSNGIYSQYAYDIDSATINKVIYPSLDPMIFEVKFPNRDIRGRVVPL